jgi:hypothetical protein
MRAQWQPTGTSSRTQDVVVLFVVDDDYDDDESRRHG